MNKMCLYLSDLALSGEEDLSKRRRQAVIFSRHEATPLVQVTSQLEVPAVCRGGGGVTIS